MSVSPPLSYQTIIFDLDGTLIDSAPSILACFDHVLREAGLTPQFPLTNSIIGPPLRQTLQHLSGVTDDTRLDSLINDFKFRYDSEGYKATRVYEGIEGMLIGLTKINISLVIATNKRRIPTMKILKHFDLLQYFRDVGTLDTPNPPLSDKAVLLKSLLKVSGAPAEKSLYVGDKWEDGVAAVANGMPFQAAGWGYGEWNTAPLPPSWEMAHSVQELAIQLCQE